MTPVDVIDLSNETSDDESSVNGNEALTGSCFADDCTNQATRGCKNSACDACCREWGMYDCPHHMAGKNGDAEKNEDKSLATASFGCAVPTCSPEAAKKRKAVDVSSDSQSPRPDDEKFQGHKKNVDQTSKKIFCYCKKEASPSCQKQACDSCCGGIKGRLGRCSYHIAKDKEKIAVVAKKGNGIVNPVATLAGSNGDRSSVTAVAALAQSIHGKNATVSPPEKKRKIEAVNPVIALAISIHGDKVNSDLLKKRMDENALAPRHEQMRRSSTSSSTYWEGNGKHTAMNAFFAEDENLHKSLSQKIGHDEGRTQPSRPIPSPLPTSQRRRVSDNDYNMHRSDHLRDTTYGTHSSPQPGRRMVSAGDVEAAATSGGIPPPPPPATASTRRFVSDSYNNTQHQQEQVRPPDVVRGGLPPPFLASPTRRFSGEIPPSPPPPRTGGHSDGVQYPPPSPPPPPSRRHSDGVPYTQHPPQPPLRR